MSSEATEMRQLLIRPCDKHHEEEAIQRELDLSEEAFYLFLLTFCPW